MEITPGAALSRCRFLSGQRRLGFVGICGVVLVGAVGAIANPSTPNIFDTWAAGVEATEVGSPFLVKQTGGAGAYRYDRTSGGATFTGVELWGPNAKAYAQARQAEAKVPAPVNGLISHLWGTSAREWDGRVIPNEVAGTPPTLNLLPDPFNPANESGSFEPVRELNTSATVDPLGGAHAMGLKFSGPNQQLIFAHGGSEAVNGPWMTPANTPLRVRIWAKRLAGSKGYTLGTFASPIELTDEWMEYATDLNPSTPVSISFGSGPANSDGVAAVAGAAIYDEFAGTELPGLERLLADQFGAHGAMPLRLPQTIAFTPEGAINNHAMGAGVRIVTGPDLPETAAYTLGVWVSPGQINDPSYGTAITIGDHLDGTAKYNQGMIGIYSNLNSAIDARGRLRPFPTNNVGKKRTGQYLLDQGWQHLAITVRDGLTTPYINGIPIYEAQQADWKAPRFNTVSVGYYLPGLRRQMANRYLPCEWQGAYVARKAFTDEEILAMDRHGRARLPISGIQPAPRALVAFGMGGREILVPDSWWWHLCENYSLTPRLHGHLEAQAAGGLSTWASPERLAFFKRQVVAAADSYNEIWCVIPSGGIDENLWISNGGDIMPYKNQFQGYIHALRALHPKIRIAVATALPRAQINASVKGEQARIVWNDWLRSHFAEMEIDQILDIGLGTERVNPDGTVTPEVLPGGTAMGDWRVARASLEHHRTPEATLQLSAVEGMDITATANPGTFTPDDVYRCLMAADGSAQITSVSADGSEVQLSTAGFSPERGAGEGADQWERDRIVRKPFPQTTFSPSTWSVQNDTAYYEKGNDPTYPGGRILGDRVAPRIQAMINDASATQPPAS